MLIVAEESVRYFSSVSDNESTFLNETDFQSDHSSTESTTSATGIANVFDNYDSASFEDEVDGFSSILLLTVARNHHWKVTLKDLNAARTANKMKQMTLPTSQK